ncbi:sialate O-acetylesterase [Rhodohalobacter sulfatireducens]|uniref:sialate O-acetylesterase n=1 Tax=Rhodohalobacter sulfatireducens TaxID=2911366 RepID=UPI001EDBB2B6|nr:sialate O-acetylesterase [Rhodohalobacter sulfatireducens]
MKNLTFLISSLLLFIIILPSHLNAQEKLDLFILAGQSNAQGWMGDAANYPEDSLGLDESIRLNWTFVDNQSSKRRWVPMQPQEGRFQEGHFGPEVSFARELKKAGFNPAIFKYTKGATGLARDWKAPGEGGIYDRMVIDLKASIDQLEEQGYEVHVRGLIWIQGESDAGDGQTSKKYYQNLKRLIEHLRNEVLHEPDLNILVGVDEQHPFVEDRPVVVEAQKRLAEEDEYISFTSMRGIQKADNTHLTPQGLTEHGRRLAYAFMNLVNVHGEGVGDTGKLKVITYNIWNGFDWGKDEERRQKVQEWMRSQKPSITALQELNNYTPAKLKEDAKSWGHPYSVLLKTTGYSVGLTSAYPIQVKEKIREGMHHGALHAKTAGIDLLVVHLHPGSIKRRMEEADILLNKLEEIEMENPLYMVLGDFNAHSPFDAHLYDPDGYLLNRRRSNNAGKGMDGNIYLNDLDYSVMASFLGFPLYDGTQKYTTGLSERGTFPGRVLGPVNSESTEQLISRLERIDYILVSPELLKRSTDAQVHNGEENWFLSDHYPVEVTFRTDQENLDVGSMIQPISEENMLRDPDYFNWGSSIIKGDDGNYHLFYSRWKRELGFTGWLTHSEIAHAISDRPEGPYQYLNTVLQGRGGDQWDAITAHNPKIKYFEGTYYLYYIGTHSDDVPLDGEKLREVAKTGYNHPMWSVLRNNQRTGVALSKSLNGPWQRRENPIVEPAGPITTLTVNPAVTQGPNGSYYMIVKGDKPNEDRFIRNQALALSETPTGPFIVQKKPVIDTIDTEDSSIWYDESRNQFFAVFHAHNFIGLITSADGVNWRKAVNYEVTTKRLNLANGDVLKPDRMERPFVYLEDGQPRVLSFAIKEGDDSYSIFVPLNH